VYQHIAFNQLEPPCIAEFITSRYHAQIRSLGPVLATQLTKLREKDSSFKQELTAISGLFQRLMDDISSHMRKEEFVLFPYIKERSREQADLVQSMPLLNSVLQQMRREHRQYSDTMAQIRRLTNNFTPPDDACPQTRLCLAVLNEFESDLLENIYLENNILFPKLIEIEEDLKTQTQSAS
jgi:regulator of cell morphogenesis and NO signaling